MTKPAHAFRIERRRLTIGEGALSAAHLPPIGLHFPHINCMVSSSGGASRSASPRWLFTDPAKDPRIRELRSRQCQWPLADGFSTFHGDGAGMDKDTLDSI